MQAGPSHERLMGFIDLQVLQSRRSCSAGHEVSQSAAAPGSQQSSPAPARRATTGEAEGASSSRPSSAVQHQQPPVVVPFQGAWPDCASPTHSGQLPPLKSWQEPGTPSAPGLSASGSRTMFYHEPGETPRGSASQPGKRSSGQAQANPLGDSVASLTQSRDAGFPADRRVRSPTRGQRPAQPAHHSVPSTVEEEQPSSSSTPQAEALLSRTASSGGTSGEALATRTSSGNPFKTIRPADSTRARRTSLGNPFALPRDNSDQDMNPFKQSSYKGPQDQSRTSQHCQ